MDSQTKLDFETPFRERMNELRARLRSVEVAVLRLSPLRWEQVVEVTMAIWAHTLPTGECKAATSRVMQTSGLTRRQYYTALAAAKELGLVRAVGNYVAGDGQVVRKSDRLRVEMAVLDALVAASRARRAKAPPPHPRPPGASGNQREQTGTRGNQREPAGTTLKEHARAKEELPLNLSSSSKAAAAEPRTVDDDEEADFQARWERARPVANRLLRVLAPGGLASAGATRREWIAKIALLAERFGADWIEPAFEQLRYSEPRNPEALVASILDAECQARGTRLHREQARERLPAWFVARVLKGDP